MKRNIKVINKDLFWTLDTLATILRYEDWEIVGSLTFPSCIRKPSEVHDIDIVVYSDETGLLDEIVESDSLYDDQYPEDFDVKHGKLKLDVRQDDTGVCIPVTVIQKPAAECTGESGAADFYYCGVKGRIHKVRDVVLGSIEGAMEAKASYLEKSGGKAAYRKKHSQDLQNYFKWKTGQFKQADGW